jgi:hypothetical protein
MTTGLAPAFAGLGKWLYREFVLAWPMFLFFLAGFLLLLLLIKLALAQFSVDIRTLSNAVVGALVAAKTVLVLDETPLARRLEQYRRIVAVAVKTLLYGVGALLLGYVERILDALHKVHNFDAAVVYTIDHASLYRLLAWALGTSLVFAVYFALFEINERMGEGALWAMFFESPAAVGDFGRHSNTSAARPSKLKRLN